MYQIFRVHLKSATEFEIMRVADERDPAGDVLLGQVTMTSKTTNTDNFDQVGLITQEERDSVWMLIETALDQVDRGEHTAFIFEVDV